MRKTCWAKPLAGVAVFLTLAGACLGAPPKASKDSARAGLSAAYGRLPLSFEANDGQAGGEVKFLARGRGYSLFLNSGEAWLALHPKSAIRHPQSVLRMELAGSNRAAQIAGEQELPGKSSYFIGSNSKQWHLNIPNYARVRSREVYPGIDLVYYGNQRQLEFDFIVAPGANPRAIALDFRGAGKLAIDGHGDLVLRSGGGEMRLRKPRVYQERGGAREQVAARYVLQGRRRIGFEVARYDASRPLIMDPVLTTLGYSTYLGGGGQDEGTAIAVDSAGNVYLTGAATSGFPLAGALQGAAAGRTDVFVAKLNAAGTALFYSTYLGGSDFDKGLGIAVDAAGNAYVTGATASTDFPTANAVQAAFGGHCASANTDENGDAFVAKLDAAGSALVYSTYLGGSGCDRGAGITVDAAGNFYVTGSTASTNFPTGRWVPVFPFRIPPLDGTCGTDGLCNNSGAGPISDAFVTNFNADGSLFFSTYLGGSGSDTGAGIAFDGSIYVIGSTRSADFPVVKPFQAALKGDSDAFVAKLLVTGSQLIYSTYLGGSSNETGAAIVLSSGFVYVTGATDSLDFPVRSVGPVPGFQPALGGATDAFVARVTMPGTDPVFNAGLGPATYLGGSGVDVPAGIAAGGVLSGVYVTGWTDSTDFPIKFPLPGQDTFRGGGTDAFVAQLSLNSSGPNSIVYSTYLGGGALDAGSAIAVDALGRAYVTGLTDSSDFPTLSALQPAPGGGGDAFVTRIQFLLVANRPPVAVAVARPNPAECAGPGGTVVTLDGSASSDPDGDTLEYLWLGRNLTLVGRGATLNLTLPVGSHSFTLEVRDGHGGSASAGVQVTVRDTTAPTLSVTLSPAVLWPPDHKLVPISAAIQVSDACDANVRVELVSVASNEPDEGLGDGDQPNDIQGAVFGTDDRSFFLRAERSATGVGRVYTITYRATDASGNSTLASAQVRVPLNQGQP